MKISDLQRQIALNRNILATLETIVMTCKHNINNLSTQALNYQQRVYSYTAEIKMYKKQIKQYAKLQRALKSELAYRIQYNRAVREIEGMNQKAKEEGWEVLIFDDDTYNQMLKGE